MITIQKKRRRAAVKGRERWATSPRSAKKNWSVKVTSVKEGGKRKGNSRPSQGSS